jgi:hypothetical protein
MRKMLWPSSTSELPEVGKTSKFASAGTAIKDSAMKSGTYGVALTKDASSQYTWYFPVEG